MKSFMNRGNTKMASIVTTNHNGGGIKASDAFSADSLPHATNTPGTSRPRLSDYQTETETTSATTATLVRTPTETTTVPTTKSWTTAAGLVTIESEGITTTAYKCILGTVVMSMVLTTLAFVGFLFDVLGAGNSVGGFAGFLQGAGDLVTAPFNYLVTPSVYNGFFVPAGSLIAMAFSTLVGWTICKVIALANDSDTETQLATN